MLPASIDIGRNRKAAVMSARVLREYAMHSGLHGEIPEGQCPSRIKPVRPEVQVLAVDRRSIAMKDWFLTVWIT